MLVAVVFACVALLLPLVSRSLLSPLTYVLTVLFFLIIGVVLVLTSNVLIGAVIDRYYPAPEIQRRTGRVFYFSTSAAWQAAVTKDNWTNKSPHSLPPLFPDYPTVSKTLNEIMIFIVRDFVNNWYTDISNFPAFPISVSATIHRTGENLIGRLTSLDAPNFLVHKILPMITTHVNQFRISESEVRGGSMERHLTRSDELDVLLASHYAGTNRLHPAISNLSTVSTRQSEEVYLRSVLDRVLPLVLPLREAQSKAVHIVVREVLACAIIAPIMDDLSDPDFWNKTIDQMAGAAIRQQKMISKVRHVLDQGTSRNVPRSEKPDTINIDSTPKVFESFLRSISRTNSLLDARRIKNDIQGEIRRTQSLIATHGENEWNSDIKAENVIAYLERLYTAKQKVERRIVDLGGSDDSRTMQASPYTTHSGIGMRDVLLNPGSLSHYMEFMDRKGKSLLVQFWLTVESFKDPLHSFDEFSERGENDFSTDTSEIELRQDLSMLAELYFSNESVSSALSIISQRDIEIIKSFVLENNSPAVPSSKARQAVSSVQRQAEHEMEQDFAEFRKTDLWFHAIKDIANSRPQMDASHRDSALSTDPEPSNPQQLWKQQAADLTLESLSSERRLLAPAITSRATSSSSFTSLITNEPSPSPHPVRSPLFEDVTEYNEEDKENAERMAELQDALADIIIEGRASGPVSEFEKDDSRQHLFPDDEHERIEHQLLQANRTLPSNAPTIQSFSAVGQDTHQVDVIVARLKANIEKLESQGQMLLALGRKAELTGESNKVELLRNSRKTIERDIRELSFQKSQYEQQQAEYQFSSDRGEVAIVSSVTEEADGRSVVRYLLEVKQLGSDGGLISGWVVARRYNEFLSLHQKLKEKYPTVRGLDFPGKKLVTSLSSSFVENRRVALEKYLQGLLDITTVRSSRLLLEFLSRDSPLRAPDSGSIPTQFTRERNQNLMRTMYKSVTGSIDDMLYGPSMLDVVVQRLTSHAASVLGIAGTRVHDEEFVAKAFQANAEANSMDPETSLYNLTERLTIFESDSTQLSFARPICDLILAIFELDHQNNWLRRQATTIILQQILGGTIERKFREKFKSMMQEVSVLEILTTFRDNLWPNGQLKEPERRPRTAEERLHSRHSANQKLSAFLPDLAANMIGRSNARRGARLVFSVLQNKRLNQHMLYTLLDEIIAALFPDLD